MAMTLADKVTLARLGLAPLIVCAYLLLPTDYNLCYWGAGLLCGIAEYTDLLDGRIARARGEVSDFGKLADPFCDVIYRLSVFLVLLLPAGGLGYPIALAGDDAGSPLAQVQQLVFAIGRDGSGAVVLGAGMAPWLPVLLMVIREIVAGALRSMSASRGLVLAARTSGKIKAWLQGVAIITLLAWPSVTFRLDPWHLTYAFWACWIAAIASVVSIVEYIWVNRLLLGGLIDRRG